MSDASEDVDEGLQPHRTALAWNRTVVAVAAVSLLLAVVAFRNTESVAVALVPLLVSPAVAVASVVRERQLREAEPRRLGGATSLAIAGAPVVLAAMGLWVVSGL
jgi:hypothetical protein